MSDNELQKVVNGVVCSDDCECNNTMKQTIKEQIHTIALPLEIKRDEIYCKAEFIDEVDKAYTNHFIGLIDEEIKLFDEAWAKDKEISYGDLINQVKGLNHLKLKLLKRDK